MQNYKIINNPDAVKEFIDWLPDLKDNEKFYLSLFARKKYCRDVIDSNDKTQLKRFTSDKERMFDKLNQLELTLGKWRIKGKEAPQESLVLYIHPIPRDMRIATNKMGKKCWDLIENKNYNLVAEAMSCVQSSKSKSVKLVTFDIDDSDADMSYLNEIFPFKCYDYIKTRGGYHVIVNTKKIKMDFRKNWYMEIKNYYNIEDKCGDIMSPFPGTIQGGHVPEFFNLNK